MNNDNENINIEEDVLPYRTETLRLDDSHIEVKDTYSVEEDGKITTYTDAEIDCAEAIFVDEDNDGEIDYVVYDVNHDDVLEGGEEFLIEDGSLYQSDLDDIYNNQIFPDDMADADIDTFE